MPGAHTYIYIVHLNLIIYTKPMAQDHGLCRKRRKQKESTNEPAHGPPLQARVAAANRTVLQLANMMVLADPGAHGMNRGKAKLNGGKNVEKGSGMTWQR